MSAISSFRAGAALGSAVALALGGVVARRANAQLPGLPVFQGAFPAPGLAAAVDVGRGSGRTMLAGAVGYGAPSGRFGLTAGVGAFGDAEPGYRKGRLGYGARVAFTAIRFMDERLAVTPFIGFGSTRATVADAQLAGPPSTAADTGSAVQSDELPIGAALGWRTGFGGGRAVALSLSPMYALYRRTGGSVSDRRGAMRIAAVADVAVASRLGVTLGVEFGQAATGTEPGPRGTRVGLGASFAIAGR